MNITTETIDNTLYISFIQGSVAYTVSKDGFGYFSVWSRRLSLRHATPRSMTACEMEENKNLRGVAGIYQEMAQEVVAA